MTSIAQHWIDGNWIDSDKVAESTNPATGETLGSWYDAGEAEARAAGPPPGRPSIPHPGRMTALSATGP